MKAADATQNKDKMGQSQSKELLKQPVEPTETGFHTIGNPKVPRTSSHKATDLEQNMITPNQEQTVKSGPKSSAEDRMKKVQGGMAKVQRGMEKVQRGMKSTKELNDVEGSAHKCADWRKLVEEQSIHMPLWIDRTVSKNKVLFHPW